MSEDNKEVWCRLRNNNGEWVSEARVLVVCEEAARTIEDIAGRCGVTLSRQKSLGITWYYWCELEHLKDSITDDTLAEECIDVIDVEEFYQNLVKAESGVAEAQFQVGFSYRFGKGVEEDVWEAVGWLRKAAMQGVAEAQFFLGDCYGSGEGVRQNDWLAIMWFKKAAEQDFEVAKAFLKNYKSTDVADWLKVAESGDVDAQYSAGLCYYHGTGLPQDYGEAVHWLTKAAEQNDYDAQMLLIRCYLHGKGVPKDVAQAEMWFNKARQNGIN